MTDNTRSNLEAAAAVIRNDKLSGSMSVCVWVWDRKYYRDLLISFRFNCFRWLVKAFPKKNSMQFKFKGAKIYLLQPFSVTIKLNMDWPLKLQFHVAIKYTCHP